MSLRFFHSNRGGRSSSRTSIGAGADGIVAAATASTGGASPEGGAASAPRVCGLAATATDPTPAAPSPVRFGGGSSAGGLFRGGSFSGGSFCGGSPAGGHFGGRSFAGGCFRGGSVAGESFTGGRCFTGGSFLAGDSTSDCEATDVSSAFRSAAGSSCDRRVAALPTPSGAGGGRADRREIGATQRDRRPAAHQLVVEAEFVGP